MRNPSTSVAQCLHDCFFKLLWKMSSTNPSSFAQSDLRLVTACRVEGSIFSAEGTQTCTTFHPVSAARCEARKGYLHYLPSLLPPSFLFSPTHSLSLSFSPPFFLPLYLVLWGLSHLRDLNTPDWLRACTTLVLDFARPTTGLRSCW